VAEARGAFECRHAFERAQHLRDIVGVRRVLACVARGIDAGRAVEHVDLEAGVVGDREHSEGVADPAGLDACVLLEGGADLFHVGRRLELGQPVDGRGEVLRTLDDETRLSARRP